MANLFQFVDWVTMESLRILKNNLVVASCFNTSYNKEFSKEFAVGETVRVKLPQRWTIRDGIGYQPQAVARTYTTVACDQVFGIDFEWDSVAAALKAERGLDAIKREYLEPAMVQIAQEIDSRAAQWAYYNSNNIVGILGTNPTDTSIAGAARTILKQKACPPGPLEMIMAPQVMNAIVNGSLTLFNDQAQVSRAFKEGYYGRARGFDWSESMSLYSHTAGVWQTPSSVTVSGGGQTGSNLLVNCTSGDTFNRGDVFQIAAVYAVNPVTRRSTGALQQFVVTQAVTASASTATIPIAAYGGQGTGGAIVGPGSQYQNVDSLPADTALLTLFPGTTTPSTGPKSGFQNLALHRDAFALIGVKLELPKAVEVSSQQRDPETGISVRFVRSWDNVRSMMTNRFDVLMGFGNLYPDSCSVRVLSA